MTNNWNQKDIPHKGWRWLDVRTEPGFCCEMCGNERVKYVHTLEHKNTGQTIEVGCICAERMCEDYTNPKQKETQLKNRLSRRDRWLKRKWKTSAKGNHYLKVNGTNTGVYKTRYGNWGYWYGDIRADNFYNTEEQAKLALFDYINKRSSTHHPTFLGELL